MRPPLPTVKEEKTVEKNVNVGFFFNYIFPFLDEAMDSYLMKINVFWSKKFIKDSPYLFHGFQGFILEKPSKGPEEVEVGWGKVRGIERMG